MPPDDGPLRLTSDTIDLWSLPRDSASRARLGAAATSWLSPDEQARLRSFERESRARLYLQARGLLRYGLARHLGAEPAALRFRESATGKPALAWPDADDLAFSLAHGADQAVLAVARARCLGVDIEAGHRADAALRIALQFFSPAEQCFLRALGADAAPMALSLWTLKESYVKAIGTTVWDGLRGLSLMIEDGRIVWLDRPMDTGAWHFVSGQFEGTYALALALAPLNGDEGTPRRHRCHVLGDADSAPGAFRPLYRLG